MGDANSNAVISIADDFHGYDEEGNSNTSFASYAMSSFDRSAGSENTSSSPVSVMQDLDSMKRRLCELERENSKLRFLSPSPWAVPSPKKISREPSFAYDEEGKSSSSYGTACRSLEHRTGVGVCARSGIGHDHFRGENLSFEAVRRKESRTSRREASLARDDGKRDGRDSGPTVSTFSSFDNDNYSMASMDGSMDIISAVGSMEDSVDGSKYDTPRQEGESPGESMRVSNRNVQHEKENSSGERENVSTSHRSVVGLEGLVTNHLYSKLNCDLGAPAEKGEGESESNFECATIPPSLPGSGDRGNCRQPSEHSRIFQRRRSSSGREGATSTTRRSSATQQLTHGSSKKSHCSNDEQDEVKYSLDSKSRYFFADGQFGIHPPANAVESSDISTPDLENFARVHHEPLRLSSTKLSSTKLGIASSGADVAVRLAQSMAVERQQQSDNTCGKDGTSRSDAFRQFFLLSISGDDDASAQGFVEESAVQGGSRFLDTFRYRQAHVMDSFTSSPTLGGSAKIQEASAAFDVAALSPFCFPGGGVRARLIPKSAVDRAKLMGWMGKHADTYQLLVFTDGSGVTSHGVAVTTREQVTSKRLVADLSLRRRRRRSAVVLSRWWRKRRSTEVVPEQQHVRQGSWWTGNRKEAINARQDVAGRRKLDWIFNKEASSRSLTSGGEESDKNDGNDTKKEDMKRRRSLDWVFKREPSLRSLGERSVGGRSVGGRSVKASRRRKDNKQNKGSKSKKWARPVSEVLSEFLETSPIEQYDPMLKTGIWCSAKLKVSRKKNQCEVIVLYAPITAEGEELEAIWKQLEEERSRLIVLLTDAFVPCGDSSKTLSVTSFRFEEKEGLATKVANESTEISESSRQLAAEAHKSMQLSEAMGEVCIVERCYVLMGGKPDELSLLLAGLQQLVDVERKEKRLEMKHCHTGPKTVEKMKQNTLRHRLLSALQTQARPSPKGEIVPWPKSDHMYPMECRRDFSKFGTVESAGSSVPPIQLPQIAGQWGLSTLLLRIGVDSLMKVLKLLLLERSVLLIGLSTEEVSSCTCTLMELLKPFEWASTFLPLLPVSMLDFVNSPVPFIVGMAAEGNKEMREIESDYRVNEALQDGMSVVNLLTGSVAVEVAAGDEEMFEIPPELSQTLHSLQSKLKELREETNCASKSLRGFVQNGLTCNESLALLSVRHSISSYVTGLCGDLAVEQSAWRQYGKYNHKTNGFDFYPNRFLAPHRQRLELMEEVVHTKMFAAFVKSKRDDASMNESQSRKIHGSLVANCA